MTIVLIIAELHWLVHEESLASRQTEIILLSFRSQRHPEPFVTNLGLWTFQLAVLLLLGKNMGDPLLPVL